MADFVVSSLGQEVASDIRLITREAIALYARATNDEHPEHLAGTLAPPLFAVVPALRTLVGAKRLTTPLFTLHASHNVRIESAILPGMEVLTTARTIGIHSSPAGALVITKGEVRTTDGSLLNVQHLVSIVQGRQPPEQIGEAAPSHRMPPQIQRDAPFMKVSYPVGRDQTLRYAEASGDRDPYTFDDEAARAKGLPGPIVHGLCTMAFLSRAVVAACGGDSRRVRRLAVRFSGLLLMQPGQSLSVRVWEAGQSEARRCLAAEADSGSGASVLRHGWAEIG